MKAIVIGVSLTMFIGAAVADDVILFDTMGPFNNWYDPNNGTSINSGDFHIESGIRFTNNSGNDLVLTKLDHGILWTNSGFNAITLSIHESAFGLPGNVLETIDVSNLNQSGMGVQSPQTAHFSGTTLLQAGAEYFITAAGPPQGGGFFWGHNTVGATGNVVLKFGVGGSWFNPGGDNITPAATVYAAAPPVPAPAALGMFGLAGLISGRRRRQWQE